MTPVPAKYVGGPCDGDRFTYDPLTDARPWRTCGGVTYVVGPLPAVPVEFWPAASAEAYTAARAKHDQRQLPAAWHGLMFTLGRTGPRKLSGVAHARARIRKRRR